MESDRHSMNHLLEEENGTHSEVMINNFILAVDAQTAIEVDTLDLKIERTRT